MRSKVQAMPRRYDAVLFDLLTALLDSGSLWNRVAGSDDRGRAWRAEPSRRAARPYPTRSTFCSIAPKIARPLASRISMRTSSPHFRNGVSGLPWRMVSTVRTSARQA